jgi:ribosomal protein L11 methyltransferase
MRWAQITVLSPEESTEAVSFALTSAGCAGVAEVTGRPCVVKGFIAPDDDEHAALRSVQAACAQLPECGLAAVDQILLDYVDERDWANEWKKHFKPTEFGKRIVVKPTWEAYAGPADKLVIELDPGMAFGTGGHPTTRLCLVALERLVVPGMRVADVGCGSGILAMAAAALGGVHIDASEIDALPRRIASENVAGSPYRNQITIMSDREFADLDASYELIVMNIVPDVIIPLLPGVAPKLAPGGRLITSGIVEERCAEVVEAVREQGLAVLEVQEDEVWRAVIAQSGPPVHAS